MRCNQLHKQTDIELGVVTEISDCPHHVLDIVVQGLRTGIDYLCWPSQCKMDLRCIEQDMVVVIERGEGDYSHYIRVAEG